MSAIIPASQNEIIQSITPDQNPALVYIASLTSARSRATMIQALNEIARLLGVETVTIADTTSARRKQQDMTFLACRWSDLRYQHTAALRAKLAETYAPATANKMLAALRGVLKQAYKLELMSADDYNRAVELKAVKGDTLPAGRDLAEGEILALVSACRRDTTAAGTRDAAIIGTLYTTGLRRAELVGLDRADLADDGKLTIRSGKGRKDRIVYITNGALTALTAWLAIRGNEAGPLFVPVNKGGNIQSGHRMTTQAVYNILTKRADEAGVKDFSPHDFRRTFASELLDRGADIVTVSKLMGHADVKTTARYDRRPEEAKRKAAGMLHFPYSASSAPQQMELPPARRNVGRAKTSAPPEQVRHVEPSPAPEAKASPIAIGTQVRLTADWGHTRPEAQPSPQKGDVGTVRSYSVRSGDYSIEFAEFDEWTCDPDEIEVIKPSGNKPSAPADDLAGPITGVKSLQERIDALSVEFERRHGQRWELAGSHARRDGRDYFADTGDGQTVYLNTLRLAPSILWTWVETGRRPDAARRQR